MSTYEERRDKRFYEATKAVLTDIHDRALQVPQDERYAAAYGILRGYFETLLTNFAEAFSPEQIGEIRIVLDQLSKVTGEDYDLDDMTKAKLDQLAQALRESED
jgi:ABC-type transporter Mla subunit MlaD